MSRINKSLEQFLHGKNLNRITSLNLSGEDLDKIPSVVFMCRNLTKLNVSHNRLTTIPKDITTLKKLKVLNFSHNRITYIPAPICGLPKLKTLNVSHNHIKTLPKQLGTAPIINFIANNNDFEEIDASLLLRTERVILSHSKITSFKLELPLPFLKHLWIHDNPCTQNGNFIIDSSLFPSIRKTYPSICEPIKTKDSQKDNNQTITENKMIKKRIFISYAHDDVKWLNILKTHLKSLQKYVGGFDYWDDQRILTGDRWKEEIEKELHSASAAILIVSPAFLASDFIENDELPPILEKAETQGTSIFPIIARKCIFPRSPISKFQSVNPPEKPLNACTEAEVDDYLYNLINDIIVKLGLDER